MAEVGRGVLCVNCMSIRMCSQKTEMERGGGIVGESTE